MKKIKILQIANNLGIGGLERVVVNLCRNIDRRKFDVAACCISFKGAFAKELEKDDIPVYHSPGTGESYYRSYCGIKSIINRFSPDIIHTHNTNALLDSFPASCLSRIPVRVHTDHARNFPDKTKYMIAERFISHFLDKIIAVSEETRDNLIRYEKIRSDKITIINNGIEKDRFDISIDVKKKKQELGLSEFQHIVGLGVRFTPQKGITNLIDAAPMILKKIPSTAFYIAGYGALLDALKQQVMKLGMSANFFFPGPRQDIPEILQMLDVFVLPSVWEGLPLVLLEAMAAKCAIVATDVGGNRTAIQDEECGFIVPPKNHQALADKITRLLIDKELRGYFGDNAYKRFMCNFSAQHMAIEHESLYLSLLKKQ